MNSESILIIGSGHLANRIKKLVDGGKYQVNHVLGRFSAVEKKESPLLDSIKNMVKDIDISSLVMVYVVDDEDERNLEFIIALLSLRKDLHITASFSNENIAPHLRAAHPNVTIINPAKIAAPVFIEKLYQPLSRSLKYTPAKPPKEVVGSQRDNFFWVMAISFFVLISSTVVYFHFAENISWLDSLYFVIVTIATVGYGDINLLNSSSTSKLVDIGLIISATFFIWMIFSLTVDRILRQREQHLLGRKRYYYKDHVILCGLGRLGYFIAEELLDRGEKLIIIEKNEDLSPIRYLRSRGADVYIGDARLPRILQDVAITQAKGVFSVINNDYVNLEIGLNARSLEPNLRLILRIFDESMSGMIKDSLDIHLTCSMSAIVDDKFLGTLK